MALAATPTTSTPPAGTPTTTTAMALQVRPKFSDPLAFERPKN